MRILRAADHKRMPWKNGKGETVEIAVFPDGATVDTFDWRVSMAPVVSDGPFSIFECIDRTLSILTGEGMMLSVEGLAPILLGPKSPPFSFRGDAKTEAVLQAGPITDLNVMTRRGHFSHRVTRFAQAGEIGFPSEVAWVIVIVTGNAKVAQVELNSLDAMILENATECGELRIETPESYFVIEIVASASD
ncbi:HutD/Ves family protein [Aliirhizobium smilacinae]|uniref:HutD family protein n=1 Tax=Aliirhizobium smilacinae TaxID=1395944 RepID=A0A5C4XDT8_9HYPH|nr:HutD family protein [Rhizobium smilacinae]TNM61667.1 HutD family protein [Rhizobium smilacinae]